MNYTFEQNLLTFSTLFTTNLRINVTVAALKINNVFRTAGTLTQQINSFVVVTVMRQIIITDVQFNQ